MVLEANTPTDAAQVAAANLKQMLVGLYVGKQGTLKCRQDTEGRKLVCSPYGGCYGLAGWVICLNGSPPRGTLILPCDDLFLSPSGAFYIDGGRSRRLSGEGQLRLVRRFWDTCLKGTSGPVSIAE